MTDRVRVIEHLQIVRTWASVGKEPIYNGIEPRCCEDVEKWMDDALALLREQEAVKPKWRQGKPSCGACGTILLYKVFRQNYCHFCGKAVKWE